MHQVSVKTTNTVPFADNTRARRLENLTNAKLLIKSGVYIFVSSGKTPLVPRFNKIDTEIAPEDREKVVEEYEAKHGEPPIHVGATRDLTVVSKMFKRYPDAVPSIACGPSKLVVVDADSKDNGPELIGKHFEEHGLPEGCVVVPTQSGGLHFIFKDPEGKYTNAAGALKKQYGCDVRGIGGQYIAPGSMREDGKTYGTKKDLIAFVRAYVHGSLPVLPEHVADLIGASSKGETPLNDADPTVKSLLEQLGANEWPDFEIAFDPAIGWSLESLREHAPDFGDLYDSPGADRSTNRFKAIRYLLGAYPEMTILDYAAFCEAWEGAGDKYDKRQLAREFAKAKASPAHVSFCTGEAFGPVVDEDQPEADQPASKAERQANRFVYIENIRGAVLRMLDWCIKYFVAKGTTSVATGMWGAGKTAVFSDIGLHVGHGFEWRGRKVTKGVVIYVALENSEDVERRVAAWCDLMQRAGRDLSGGAFVVHRGPCRLFDPSGKPTKDEKDLIEIAKTAAAHYGLPVAMIVIDTLAQSIMPGNDNDAKDAGIYTAAMQRIVAATGANVTALAHPTKSGDGVRGSGALQANVDTVIEVSRDAGGRGTIKAGSKFRIGNPAKVMFGYRLRSHSIGTDDEGDDITVVLAEDQPTPNIAVEDLEDDDVPAATDTPADKLAATLRVFRERVEGIAAETGEAVDKIGMKAGEILAALNKDRGAAGLPELKDRTIVPRLLRRLADDGVVVKSGDNRRTEYRLIR
jgi:hypothetical protein